MNDPIRFASGLCGFAGWSGILALLALLFSGAHLPYLYGLIGAFLSWHIALLLLARDPVTYRVFLVPAGLGKLSLATTWLALFAGFKAPFELALCGGLDLLLAGGFFFSPSADCLT